MAKKELGDYILLEKLGQGSFGEAFTAEHKYMKKRFVVKVLPKHLSEDPKFIERFKEEVSLLAKLEHTNIVKMHTVSHADGRYFLVTDHVEGGINLADYAKSKDNRFDEETLFKLLLQIANALDYAHRGGAIHRSLKLNNIIIQERGDEITPYISDFGLSKILGPAKVTLETFKAVAESLGKEARDLSPLYFSFLQNYTFLAPELKRFDINETITPKVDVYAFGVLAYYLIAGRFPEGFFEMPKTISPKYKLRWDHLIKSSLSQKPEDRVERLIPLMKSILATETKTVQPQVPKVPSHLVTAEISENDPVLSEEDEKELRPVIRSQEIQRPRHDLDPASALQVDTTVKQYQPETKITVLEPIHTKMSIIEGGTFMRGSNGGNRDEMPKHQVKISSFAIDIHPVTNEQFMRFLQVMGGEKDRNHNDIIRLKDSRIKRNAGKLNIESGYNKHPVVGVTWYGCQAYAKWVGKRLPREVEWEIAARGGDEEILYPTGEDIDKKLCNYFSSDTTAVMSYQPNRAGLYDMAGNVYEWCEDWYGYNYYEESVQEPENPTGPAQGVYRVLRGGCWKSLKDDLVCSRRHRNNPGTVNSTYGFRCAADVQ